MSEVLLRAEHLGKAYPRSGDARTRLGAFGRILLGRRFPQWDVLHDSGTHGSHHARVVTFLKDQGVQAIVVGPFGESRPTARVGPRGRAKGYIARTGPPSRILAGQCAAIEPCWPGP